MTNLNMLSTNMIIIDGYECMRFFKEGQLLYLEKVLLNTK